ncbi:killer cell lectin-like receptor subfamily G member 1 isoform X3 [Caloenas nicobarica]|uniref:killer cell lectin-like receptor subfamily G member 1 isoform X3 n=1 Tax=Caloenas nicobarica TaxID=187106 RepID=UPI0032B7FC94
MLQMSCDSCRATELNIPIASLSCSPQSPNMKLGWKQALGADKMTWTQDWACDKQRDCPSHLPLGQGEKSRVCDNDGNTEKRLDPQYRGASLKPELPGKRTSRRLLAGRDGGRAAAVLGCPDDWVGYRNVCYYLSSEEGSWEWGQERCSSLGASLAVIKREWEMEFLSRLKGNIDYWVGLRRQDGRLEWVDGSSFNDTITLKGQESCFWLNYHDLWSSNCFRTHHYLCSKAQALM